LWKVLNTGGCLLFVSGGGIKMSGLQLNGPVLDYKAFPEEGTVPNTGQMPLLIAEGRTPLSVAGLMRRRLEVLGGSEVVRHSWFDNSFDTGDGAVRHSDGRLKVVVDAQYLRSLSPKTGLVNGAVPLSDDVYKGLVGEEFSPDQVGRFFNKALSRRKAKVHPGWLALARGDKALLGEFVDVTFAQAKERFRYDGEMMGVYSRSVPGEGAAGCLWFVSRLDGGIFNSRASGYDHLDYYGGLLVGVREVAPEAPRDDGTQIVRPTLDQTVKALSTVRDQYVPEVGKAGFDREVREVLNPLYK
jgi:hypothetical protein